MALVALSCDQTGGFRGIRRSHAKRNTRKEAASVIRPGYLGPPYASMLVNIRVVVGSQGLHVIGGVRGFQENTVAIRAGDFAAKMQIGPACPGLSAANSIFEASRFLHRGAKHVERRLYSKMSQWPESSSVPIYGIDAGLRTLSPQSGWREKVKSPLPSAY